jgi:hypothetical protein
MKKKEQIATTIEMRSWRTGASPQPQQQQMKSRQGATHSRLPPPPHH